MFCKYFLPLSEATKSTNFLQVLYFRVFKEHTGMIWSIFLSLGIWIASTSLFSKIESAVTMAASALPVVS